MSHVCEICDIHCSSAIFLVEHLNSKKHAAVVEEAERLHEISQRSVFLSNFHSRVEVEDVFKALQGYGELERVLLDKNNFSYAIVEFRRSDEAQRLLHSIKKLQIGDNLINVCERKVEFTNLQVDDLKITNEDMKCLQNVSIANQLDILIDKFGLSLERFKEREEFTNNLKKFLQQFFINSIEVRIFGSSAIGLALSNADLDLNFFINESVFSKYNLNQLDNNLIESKDSYTKDKFLQLSKFDRVHFLTKLINKFRKVNGIQTQITPALNARCPVVRFLSRIPSKAFKKRSVLSCELSVNNLLGEKKANFIKSVIDADLSGNLKKIFFLIKLWAHCNGLFVSANQKQTKSNWNSYTLLLLVVSFLQFKKLFENFCCSLNEIDGWKVEYLFAKIDLSNINLTNFLKTFFIFLYNSIRDSNVYSICNAKIFTKTEFCEKYSTKSNVMKNFKFSLVNVQDPIELSHNVASNVSRNALVRFRKTLMFSIFALKKQNDNDISCLFQLDSLETKFVATTEANFQHNLEQKKSGNILTIDLGSISHSSSVIFDSFATLFNDVLLIEKIDEPLAKRSRQNSLKPSFLNSFAKINDDDELLRDSCTLNFNVTFPTWLGRRGTRRKLAAEINQNISPLQIEKEVSKKLKTNSKSNIKPFIFVVQLYIIETTQKEDNYENPKSNNSSFTSDIIESAISNQELHAHFQLKSNNNDDEILAANNSTLFRDLLHFLLTFLTKYLPLMLENKNA